MEKAGILVIEPQRFDEAAYAKGNYLVELSCFNHNPFNFD